MRYLNLRSEAYREFMDEFKEKRTLAEKKRFIKALQKDKDEYLDYYHWEKYLTEFDEMIDSFWERYDYRDLMDGDSPHNRLFSLWSKFYKSPIRSVPEIFGWIRQDNSTVAKAISETYSVFSFNFAGLLPALMEVWSTYYYDAIKDLLHDGSLSDNQQAYEEKINQACEQLDDLSIRLLATIFEAIEYVEKEIFLPFKEVMLSEWEEKLTSITDDLMQGRKTFSFVVSAYDNINSFSPDSTISCTVLSDDHYVTYHNRKRGFVFGLSKENLISMDNKDSASCKMPCKGYMGVFSLIHFLEWQKGSRQYLYKRPSALVARPYEDLIKSYDPIWLPEIILTGDAKPTACFIKSEHPNSEEILNEAKQTSGRLQLPVLIFDEREPYVFLYADDSWNESAR